MCFVCLCGVACTVSVFVWVCNRQGGCFVSGWNAGEGGGGSSRRNKSVEQEAESQ